MFIWTGWGWLGYLITIGIPSSIDGLGWKLGGDFFMRDHVWLLVPSFIASTAACWFLGRRLNRDLPPRILGFNEAKNPMQTFQGHTFFFLSLESGGIASAFFTIIWGFAVHNRDW